MKFYNHALLMVTGSICFWLALVWSIACAVSTPAYSQPCQWNYSMVDGVATANYCGNATVNGNVSQSSISSIAEMQAIKSPKANQSVVVTGKQGAGSSFVWTEGSLPCNANTGGGDGGTKFCAYNPSGGYLTTGYWQRQYSGALDVNWFGTTPTGSNFVDAPVLGPGLQWSTYVAGTVAANTYQCEITYNGTSGGETTVGAGGGQTVVVTSTGGSLFCQPEEAPAGAASFNVYWSTNGSNYYLGHSNVPFQNGGDIQSTTPPTSGTAPPATNTALGVMADVQAALGSSGGAYVVPQGATAGVGPMGEAKTNQTIFDQRNGTIMSNVTAGFPAGGLTTAVQQQGWYLKSTIPDNQPAGAAYMGLRVTNNAGECSYGLNNPAANPVSTAAIFSSYRCGTSTDWIWGSNPYVYFTNELGNAYAIEPIVNNSSGQHSGTEADGVGVHVLSAAGIANAGVAIGGPGKFDFGISIAGSAINEYGILIGNAPIGITNLSSYIARPVNDATSSGNVLGPSTTWQSNVWNGSASVTDAYVLQPGLPSVGSSYSALSMSYIGPASNPSFQLTNLQLTVFAASGQPTLRLVPKSDDTNASVIGQNAAGSATTWEVNNLGDAYVRSINVNGGPPGVSCSGAPTASFASVNGIVTHC